MGERTECNLYARRDTNVSLQYLSETAEWKAPWQMAWPTRSDRMAARSPGLAPCDLFLWGRGKDVYKNKTQTLAEKPMQFSSRFHKTSFRQQRRWSYTSCIENRGVRYVTWNYKTNCVPIVWKPFFLPIIFMISQAKKVELLFSVKIFSGCAVRAMKRNNRRSDHAQRKGNAVSPSTSLLYTRPIAAYSVHKCTASCL